ncbi:unnamed protein product [Amoebophrya sp. A120]|nr:unnamed protein product [Amoebophrya sp. A120]|eukprot:GSA120T00001917001.1
MQSSSSAFLLFLQRRVTLLAACLGVAVAYGVFQIFYVYHRYLAAFDEGQKYVNPDHESYEERLPPSVEKGYLVAGVGEALDLLQDDDDLPARSSRAAYNDSSASNKRFFGSGKWGRSNVVDSAENLFEALAEDFLIQHPDPNRLPPTADALPRGVLLSVVGCGGTSAPSSTGPLQKSSTSNSGAATSLEQDVHVRPPVAAAPTTTSLLTTLRARDFFPPSQVCSDCGGGSEDAMWLQLASRRSLTVAVAGPAVACPPRQGAARDTTATTPSLDYYVTLTRQRIAARYLQQQNQIIAESDIPLFLVLHQWPRDDFLNFAPHVDQQSSHPPPGSRAGPPVVLRGEDRAGREVVTKNAEQGVLDSLAQTNFRFSCVAFDLQQGESISADKFEKLFVRSALANHVPTTKRNVTVLWRYDSRTTSAPTVVLPTESGNNNAHDVVDQESNLLFQHLNLNNRTLTAALLSLQAANKGGGARTSLFSGGSSEEVSSTAHDLTVKKSKLSSTEKIIRPTTSSRPPSSGEIDMPAISILSRQVFVDGRLVEDDAEAERSSQEGTNSTTVNTAMAINALTSTTAGGNKETSTTSSSATTSPQEPRYFGGSRSRSETWNLYFPDEAGMVVFTGAPTLQSGLLHPWQAKHVHLGGQNAVHLQKSPELIAERLPALGVDSERLAQQIIDVLVAHEAGLTSIDRRDYALAALLQHEPAYVKKSLAQILHGRDAESVFVVLDRECESGRSIFSR